MISTVSSRVLEAYNRVLNQILMRTVYAIDDTPLGAAEMKVTTKGIGALSFYCANYLSAPVEQVYIIFKSKEPSLQGWFSRDFDKGYLTFGLNCRCIYFKCHAFVIAIHQIALGGLESLFTFMIFLSSVFAKGLLPYRVDVSVAGSMSLHTSLRARFLTLLMRRPVCV